MTGKMACMDYGNTAPHGTVFSKGTEERVPLERFDESHLLVSGTRWRSRPGADRVSVHGGSFREDAKLTSLPTWTLIEDEGALSRLCSYSRRALPLRAARGLSLAVRGAVGYGTTLIRELARWGTAEFATDSHFSFRCECSALGRIAGWVSANSRILIRRSLCIASSTWWRLNSRDGMLADVRQMAMKLLGSTESAPTKTRRSGGARSTRPHRSRAGCSMFSSTKWTATA